MPPPSWGRRAQIQHLGHPTLGLVYQPRASTFNYHSGQVNPTDLPDSGDRFDVLYYEIYKQAYTRNLCTLWHDEHI